MESFFIKLQPFVIRSTKSSNELQTTAFNDREREKEREKEGIVDRSEGLGNESLCNLTLRLSAETVREMRLRACRRRESSATDVSESESFFFSIFFFRNLESESLYVCVSESLYV